jgi:hypothetical protein
MPRCVVSLIALLVITTWAAAAPEGFTQVGNVLFKIPPGWQQGERQGETVLVPPDVPEGKTAVLTIFPGETLTGEFRAWFDEKWAAVKGEATVVEASQVSTEVGAGGLELLRTVATLQDAQQGKFIAFLFAAKAGDRGQLFLYITDDPTLVSEHVEGLKAFRDSLTFANLQPQSEQEPAATPDEGKVSPSFTWGEVPPATGNAGLSGVYYRGPIITEVGPGQEVVAGRFVTHTHYWCFFPDGRCYYSMPTEGLDNFNYDYVRPMNELWCCTYTLDGDNGVITWGTGGTTVPFRRVGKKLAIKSDTDIYELLDPCNGLLLEGTYKRYDWQDEYSPKEGITFSRDGTFVDEGFLGGAITTWWWADRGTRGRRVRPGEWHVPGGPQLPHPALLGRPEDSRQLPPCV